MAKRRPSSLTANDYLVRDQDGQDIQIASARLLFIEAVARVVPAFLKRLRNLCPEYGRLADLNPEYWMTGSRFETWQSSSDRDNQFTPVLMAWAEEFNVQREDWILEGALQSLSYWHEFPRLRAALDITGFVQWHAFTRIISAENHRFRFSDGGWDPTLMSAAGWRTYVRKRFEAALRAHVNRVRKIVVDRGAIPAVGKFSVEHFEWLAQYQCGNASLDSILHRASNIADKTTISKGIHRAASLAGIAVRPKSRKLKES